ncbi:hypothetical protein SLA2020_343010, partial [Shorea laevis]
AHCGWVWISVFRKFPICRGFPPPLSAPHLCVGSEILDFSVFREFSLQSRRPPSRQTRFLLAEISGVVVA